MASPPLTAERVVSSPRLISQDLAIDQLVSRVRGAAYLLFFERRVVIFLTVFLVVFFAESDSDFLGFFLDDAVVDFAVLPVDPFFAASVAGFLFLVEDLDVVFFPAGVATFLLVFAGFVLTTLTWAGLATFREGVVLITLIGGFSRACGVSSSTGSSVSDSGWDSF